MRIRSKRRRLFMLSKLFIVFAFIIGVYFFILSISRKAETSIKILLRPKIYIVESESDAYVVWENNTDKSSLDHKPGTLIGVNSHCNDGLYMKWKKNITNIIDVSDALSKLVDIPLQAIYPAVSGLFRKIMCVYPWWKRNNEIYLHHTNYLGVRDESLCLCTTKKNHTSLNESACRIVNGGPETFVSASDCRALGEHWETFIMQEIYAQTWHQDISDTDRTMLNINLDFFTVDKEQLLPSKDIIERIETQINTILCPINMQYETAIDAWFREVLNKEKMSIDEFVWLLDKYNMPFCSDNKKSTKIQLKSLLVSVANLSLSAREQLMHVGLCIRSYTLKYGNVLSLVVCSGQLDVDVLDLAHSAGVYEIALQIEKLTHFLKQSVSAPNLITIIRSTRLGLVSPSNQQILESLLLPQLVSLYHVNVSDIVYHSSLLGGATGWSQRFNNTQSDGPT